MIKKEIILKNKTGLHARPAAIFVQLANKFASEITIIKGNQKVNGKSIMGILMLAAERGAKISIIADGDDEAFAIDKLTEILETEHDLEL